VDYVLGTKGSLELDILANRMETTPLDKVTYEVPNDLGKHVPMTYCAVQSIEEGEDYHRQHFPRIPDILYPAMARYSFGDLSQMTKKDFERTLQLPSPPNPLLLDAAPLSPPMCC